MNRVRVRKTYKMFLGGAFVRSESGRVFEVSPPRGRSGEAVVVPLASRKDVRDAVTAAAGAASVWAARSAYNRGQILYRLAEVMEARAAELRGALTLAGRKVGQAADEVEVAVDRAVYYAGFCDKFQALVASYNPVPGPYLCVTFPEPVGVVGVLAPSSTSLLGLVSTVLPVLAGGNTCVVLANEVDPRTAVLWSECVATSDVPPGVVNVLTGRASELASHLAKHREVSVLDAWLADEELREEVERAAVDGAKRVISRPAADAASLFARTAQGLGWIEPFLETKTVWHSAGL